MPIRVYCQAAILASIPTIHLSPRRRCRDLSSASLGGTHLRSRGHECLAKPIGLTSFSPDVPSPAGIAGKNHRNRVRQDFPWCLYEGLAQLDVMMPLSPEAQGSVGFREKSSDALLENHLVTLSEADVNFTNHSFFIDEVTRGHAGYRKSTPRVSRGVDRNRIRHGGSGPRSPVRLPRHNQR